MIYLGFFIGILTGAGMMLFILQPHSESGLEREDQRALRMINNALIRENQKLQETVVDLTDEINEQLRRQREAGDDADWWKNQ